MSIWHKLSKPCLVSLFDSSVLSLVLSKTSQMEQAHAIVASFGEDRESTIKINSGVGKFRFPSGVGLGIFIQHHQENLSRT